MDTVQEYYSKELLETFASIHHIYVDDITWEFKEDLDELEAYIMSKEYCE